MIYRPCRRLEVSESQDLSSQCRYQWPTKRRRPQDRLQTNRRGIRLLRINTDTAFPVRSSLTRAGDRLEINNHIVSKDLALCHDVEVVAVAVLVGTTDCWAPLRISIVRAEVCDHDDDALASNTACATGGARRLSC